MSLYDRRKTAGLCVKCGWVSRPGKTNCAHCYARTKAYRAARGQAERIRSYNRGYRNARVKAGVCRQCGKKKLFPGYVHCEPCLRRRNALVRRARQKKRASAAKPTP